MPDRALLSVILSLCVLSLSAALVFIEPVSVPHDLDFSPLWLSVTRAYKGEGLYTLNPELLDYHATRADLRGEIPFPGPPWYVALLLPLGLLSPTKAALTWALLNIGFLCCSVALVSRGHSILSLGILCVLSLISAPAQGHLVVGQFTILAGFGFALVVLASRRDSHLLAAIGMVLATFRPHFGVPFMALALVKAAQASRHSFLIRLSWCLGLFVALAVLALLIDSTSITAYAPYLRALNSLPVNKLCDTCSSFPIVALRPWQSELEWIWAARFTLSVVCWLLLGIPLLLSAASLEVVLSGAMFVALLAAPYARNYDYVLLIPPLIAIWRAASGVMARSDRLVARGLVLSAAVVAGVGPYFTERAPQSNYLWLAPCLGYFATLMLTKAGVNHESAPRPT